MADCTAWVLGGLWPAELSALTDETAVLAAYLSADLHRIAATANDRLKALDQVGMAGPARQTQEQQVINHARDLAVRRVASTVRALRQAAPEPDGPEPEPDTPVGEPPAEPDSGHRRLQRLLMFVARQQPQLCWAVGDRADATTVLVTDVARGWIPPGVALPAGVDLLEPGRHDGDAVALLGSAALSAAYAPGDRLGSAADSGPTESSSRPRTLPAVAELETLLAEAAEKRPVLSGLAHSLAEAAADGTEIIDAELDLLRVHLDTARYQLLIQYPDTDAALLCNCVLLAAIEGIATGDRLAANYHFAWFQALADDRAQ